MTDADHKPDIADRLRWHRSVADEPDADCQEAAALLDKLRATAACDEKMAFHRAGDKDPVPKNVRLAHSVSVVRCECGMVCIRFHKPATYTHPGPVFAAAFVDQKQSASIGNDVVTAIDLCRDTMPCDGRH